MAPFHMTVAPAMPFDHFPEIHFCFYLARMFDVIFIGRSIHFDLCWSMFSKYGQMLTQLSEFGLTLVRG